MRLHLVRHGRTPSNVARLLDTAVPGADLDDTGRAQAEQLVERLEGVPLDAVYASDLVRTQQTVGPLAQARGLDVGVLGGLREIQAGDDEMSPDWRRYVGALRQWGEGNPDARVPGGEDADAFFGRFDAAVDEIVAAGHESALLVSHGAALRLWIAARVGGIDVAEVVGRRLGNATVVTVERVADGTWRHVEWDEIDDPGEWPQAPTPSPETVELTDAEASSAAPGWRVLAGRLHLGTRWESFAEALAFVNAVAELAEAVDHHPEIDLRHTGVHLALSSHDVGAITPRDLAFANQVSVLVHERNGRPETAALGVVEIGIDTLDAAAIAPFWAAVLGYGSSDDDEIVDARRIGPTIWFQQLDEPRESRNRVHVDVYVAHDEADARVEAAVAAGGRVVSRDFEPAWTVLADAEGNEACVCTWRDPAGPDRG